MNNIETAIKMVSEGTDSYVKFLSVNDTGKNNTHQSGVLISKTVKDMLFKGPLPSDRITDRWASIHWLNVGISTNSRFIYYASKNELRITNFSHGFPLLNPEEAGSLFILTKNNEQDYSAFIIDNGDEINDFLTYFGITPDNTNNYLPKLGYKPVKELIQSFVTDYFQKMHVFPTSIELSQFGRNLSYQIYGDTIDPIKNPDHALLIWSNSEFELFSGFEAKDIELRGGLQQIFAGDLDAYKINSIMNRRKSRAGKSLENQLEYLFKANIRCIQYVVLHELTHLLYPNHSKQFYDFLTVQMPDWTERKKQLDHEVVQGL